MMLKTSSQLQSVSNFETTMTKTCRTRGQAFAMTLLATLIVSGCSGLNTSSVGSSASSTIDEPDLAKALSIDQHRLGRHVYLAAGIGASRLEPDTSEVSTFGVNDRVNAGGQITLGMDINRMLTVELHSADLGSAGLSPGGRINYHQYGASALIYAGKNRDRYKRQGFTGYGRLGVGTLDNSGVGEVPFDQTNSTHVLFGAGVEYMTQIGLGLRAEVISYDEDVQYGQLALVYRTGKRPSRRAVTVAQAAPHQDTTLALATLEPPLAKATAEPNCEASSYPEVSVYFAPDSSELDVQSKQTIVGIADTLIQCDAMAVNLAGYTDNIGSQRYNDELSLRRVSTVMEVLSQMHVDSARMDANGLGELQPAAPNDSADGRRLNRRVSITLN